MKLLRFLFPQNHKKQIPLNDMKYLIAGLGNFGIDYVNTRHNIGFDVIEKMAADKNVVFTSGRYADIAEFKFKGKTFLLIKPTTYMNLSGKAVKYWMEKENIEKENILVITDDLNLSFGTIRIKAKGSDGGHNGLKSIQSLLATTEYARFRFGISDEFKKGKQVDYVLGEWNEDEKAKLPERLDKSIEIVYSFALAGLNNTMNEFNGK